MLPSNPYGHFSSDGQAFVVTDPETPRPWVNVISNGDMGLVVSQAGGGFSWRTHANLNRLTRWEQDLIRDASGKWLYLRDRSTDALRSLAFQPVQATFDSYEVSHGLGHTTFTQSGDGLKTEWTLFVAPNGDPVEIWLVTVTNTGSDDRRLQLASYFEWNLGAAPDNHREFHKLFIETRFEPSLNALVAEKYLWEIPTDRGHWNTDWPYVGFHAAGESVAGWDTSKDALIGRHGSVEKPKGLGAGHFSGTSGRFQDPSASLAVNLDLAPGAAHTTVFLLGQPDRNGALGDGGSVEKLIGRYGTVEAATAALDGVKAFWSELTGRTTVQTPDPSFDTLVNTWLPYQAIDGHLWARIGYYQQSGAYGFRDQMQTSQVWLPLDPAKMLEHAKLNARHQYADGTVLHWWHPLTEQGLRTRMTDDLLWLPFMLTKYLREVGHTDDLADIVPYYDGGEGSLMEHCTRAIDNVLARFSPRGLPLIGEGDWCDGFSAVGLDEKGESVWLGMFLYQTLLDWMPLVEPDRAARYRQRADALKTAINEHGFNGRWYIAATKDDGTPIGDPSQPECQIFLNAQTWAILTGIADETRSESLIKAMFEHLASENGMLLLNPAFSQVDRYIGYLTRYTPGLRENGGVYTHAATWAVLACAHLNRADDAMKLFHQLNPILQSAKDADRYVAEPYVLPGNVDGPNSERPGRAGWTWYTGAAGWLRTIALEAICGVRATTDGLLIDPCIPADWPEITVKRRFRGSDYTITVRNPDGNTAGVIDLTLDGKRVSGAVVPAQPAGGAYQVEVTLTGRRVGQPVGATA